MTQRPHAHTAVGTQQRARVPATDMPWREGLPLARIEDLRISFSSKRGIISAVDGVTFAIGDGETVGLVGETGCGKSVTARSFLRLVPTPPGIYASGRILFSPRTTCPACDGAGCTSCGGLGRVAATCPTCGGSGCEVCDASGFRTLDLLTIPEHRMREIRGNRIAMIFQDPAKALNPALSIRRQLAEVFCEHRWRDLLADAGLTPDEAPTGASRTDGSRTAGATRDAGWLLRRAARQRSRAPERWLLSVPPWRSRTRRLATALDERIADALADTHIANPRKLMASYPHELSGGMKQRVMIAQALACDPDLLIADEPTTALDVTIQARILDLIAELQQRHHTAVLYISHDLSLVRGICDRVVVMYAGRVAEASPSTPLFTTPLHPYTRGLMAAIPTASHRRGQLVAIEGSVPELIDPTPSCRFSTRCPHAAPVCRTIDPPLVRRGDDHDVACFLHMTPAEVGVDADQMPDDRPSRR